MKSQEPGPETTKNTSFDMQSNHAAITITGHSAQGQRK